MKFLSVVTLLAVLPAAFTQTPVSVSVSFDRAFDNPAGDLHTVACSDGPNGLLTRGFTNFSSLPTFPNISGAFAVAGFNSPNCGTCWNVTFQGTTVSVLAIDVASGGFNMALAAMNSLTHNNAEFLGRVNATAVQVPAAVCGTGEARKHPPVKDSA